MCQTLRYDWFTLWLDSDKQVTLGSYPVRGHIKGHIALIVVGWCQIICLNMMTSSNGNILRVTGPLCGEFTGHRWIPLTKASDAELWCAHYDVTSKPTLIRHLTVSNDILWWRSMLPGSYFWDNNTGTSLFIKSLKLIWNTGCQHVSGTRFSNNSSWLPG